jgi:molybdopterin molybdotransferase
LLAQIQQAGAVAKIMNPVGDRLDLLGDALERAFEQADLVITSGGVSVGDRDVLVDWFEAWQGQLLFNKLKMRPGSPTTVGVREGKIVFALSGNPGACFVGFELLVVPVIRRMMQQSDRRLAGIHVRLDRAFTKPDAFERYLRGRMEWRDQRWHASLHSLDQSSVVRSAAGANALIVIPPGNGVEAGMEVMAIPLQDWGVLTNETLASSTDSTGGRV